MSNETLALGIRATISVAASSGGSKSTALPTGHSGNIRILNAGAVVVFVKAGASDVSAATTDFPLAAGMDRVLDVGEATHLAARAASSTATVYATSLVN